MLPTAVAGCYSL